MPVSPEVLKILQGGAWASAGGALVQDPSDATPAVTRANGYGAAYSSTLVPEQETIQGRWNEFDSAIIDIFESGVPFYDAMIDYPANALTNENGVLSRALVANGPTAGNAIAPSADTGGTTWARVSGTQSAPSAPAQPTAVAGNGTLDVSWNCPLDGGSAITRFEFQYRNAGGSWPGTQRNVTVPRAVLTGLTNGQAIEFRVRAVNAIGESDWSPTGTGTPTASVPVGGSSLALRAQGGNANAVLNWLEPDTGGAPILRYEVQWRTSGQGFSSSRQRDVTSGTTDTVPGLSNGTQYFFQVRAVNSAGPSTWSNEASATPSEPYYERTTAGATSFAWPWSTTRGLLIITGGGGGGAGDSGANAQNALVQGTAGTDGGDTTVQGGGVSHTASGGNGGEGGAFVSVSGQPSLYLGNAGARAQAQYHEITVSQGAVLSINVGTAGVGGARGGVRTPSGSPRWTNGDDGTAGSVYIAPLY